MNHGGPDGTLRSTAALGDPQSPADGPPTLLIVDFRGIGGLPALSRVTEDWPGQQPLCRIIDPVERPVPAPSPAGPPSLAELTRAALGVAGPQPFILAQCTGTATAFGLARGLADQGRPPAGIVLFAPVLPTARSVMDAAVELMCRLGAAVEDARRRAALLAPDAPPGHPPASGGTGDSGRDGPPPRTGTGPADAAGARGADAVDAALYELAAGLAERMGMTQDEAEVFVAELAGRYSRWLRFLRGQLDSPPWCPPPGCPVHLIDRRPAEAATMLIGAIGPLAVRHHLYDNPAAVTDPALRTLVSRIVLPDRAGTVPSGADA